MLLMVGRWVARPNRSRAGLEDNVGKKKGIFMTKRLSYYVFLMSLLMAMTVGETRAMAQQGGPSTKSPEPVQKIGVVAHRGFHKYEGSAENTVSAMLNAASHDFAGTEFDMQMTGDDVAIIFHDDKLEGLPIGEASHTEVFEHPASTLANGERIPTLPQFMDSYAKALAQQLARNTSTWLFFEIKAPRNPDKIPLAAATAMEAVRQRGLEKNVCFISFSLAVCKLIADQMPDVSVAYLGGDMTPQELKEMGINSIDYNYKVLLEHPEWIQEAKKMGMKVNVWTVNDEKIARQMKEMGVDFITTDLPLDMERWLEDK